MSIKLFIVNSDCSEQLISRIILSTTLHYPSLVIGQQAGFYTVNQIQYKLRVSLVLLYSTKCAYIIEMKPSVHRLLHGAPR